MNPCQYPYFFKLSRRHGEGVATRCQQRCALLAHDLAHNDEDLFRFVLQLMKQYVFLHNYLLSEVTSEISRARYERPLDLSC